MIAGGFARGWLPQPDTFDTAPATVTVTRRQLLFISWLAYLLVDIVVLNLLIEFVPSVVIESFYISILTAVLLRGLLEVTLRLERQVARGASSGAPRWRRLLGSLVRFLILFSSKFVILEVVDIVFGDRVDLGGVLEIVAIAAALLVAEMLVQQLLVWLGRVPTAT
jgi:hypothetical protein